MECVATALHVTHDEVRRGLWPLSDRGQVRVRPGRCRTCGRRRVVVHSTRPRSAPGRGYAPIEAVAAPTNGVAHHAGKSSNGNGAAQTAERQAATQRLLTRLVDASGDPCCPACLALGAGASLEDVRNALSATGPLRHFVVEGGECSGCGRQQTLLAALPARRSVG
jgi:hypothetical protein